MKDTTTIYFIRHGELDNPGEIFYERQLDILLSAEGKAHIQRLAEYLKHKGVTPDIFFASPLKRTIQSAEIFSKVFDEIEIHQDKRLLERDSKNLAGRPIALEKVWIDTYNNLHPDYWVETPEDQAKRIGGFTQEVLKQYKGKTIFVLSHGDPLAFAVYNLIHPKNTIPSINNLTGENYLKRGEAWKVEFDETFKATQRELMKI